MRHFGVPSSFTTGRPSLTMSAVKAVYQKICWAIVALRRDRAGLGEGHAGASGGA